MATIQELQELRGRALEQQKGIQAQFAEVAEAERQAEIQRKQLEDIKKGIAAPAKRPRPGSVEALPRYTRQRMEAERVYLKDVYGPARQQVDKYFVDIAQAKQDLQEAQASIDTYVAEVDAAIKQLQEYQALQKASAKGGSSVAALSKSGRKAYAKIQGEKNQQIENVLLDLKSKYPNLNFKFDENQIMIQDPSISKNFESIDYYIIQQNKERSEVKKQLEQYYGKKISNKNLDFYVNLYNKEIETTRQSQTGSLFDSTRYATPFSMITGLFPRRNVRVTEVPGQELSPVSRFNVVPENRRRPESKSFVTDVSQFKGDTGFTQRLVPDTRFTQPGSNVKPAQLPAIQKSIDTSKQLQEESKEIRKQKAEQAEAEYQARKAKILKEQETFIDKLDKYPFISKYITGRSPDSPFKGFRPFSDIYTGPPNYSFAQRASYLLTGAFGLLPEQRYARTGAKVRITEVPGQELNSFLLPSKMKVNITDVPATVRNFNYARDFPESYRRDKEIYKIEKENVEKVRSPFFEAKKRYEQRETSINFAERPTPASQISTVISRRLSRAKYEKEIRQAYRANKEFFDERSPEDKAFIEQYFLGGKKLDNNVKLSPKEESLIRKQMLPGNKGSILTGSEFGMPTRRQFAENRPAFNPFVRATIEEVPGQELAGVTVRDFYGGRPSQITRFLTERPQVLAGANAGIRVERTPEGTKVFNEGTQASYLLKNGKLVYSEQPYQQIDSRFFGGLLPGGNTPEQVRIINKAAGVQQFSRIDRDKIVFDKAKELYKEYKNYPKEFGRGAARFYFKTAISNDPITREIIYSKVGRNQQLYNQILKQQLDKLGSPEDEATFVKGFATAGTTAILAATAGPAIAGGYLFSGPITRTTSGIIDKLIPVQDSGFAPTGILPQIGRGALFTASTFVPGVGSAYATDIAKQFLTNPKEAYKSTKDFVTKNPYEIASVLLFGAIAKRGGERVRAFRETQRALETIDREIIREYGKDSAEYRRFRDAVNRAYGEGQLPVRQGPTRPYTPNQIESIANDPLAIEIVTQIVNKYKPVIIGSSTIIPFSAARALEELRRGLQGDIDVQTVQGIVNNRSKAMAQELYQRLVNAGYKNARYSVSEFPEGSGQRKYHVYLGEKELLNAGSSVKRRIGEVAQVRKLFETSFLGRTVVDPYTGVRIGSNLDNLRRKIIAGYGENLGDIQTTVKALRRIYQSVEDGTFIAKEKAFKKEGVGRAKDLVDILDIIDGSKGLFKKVPNLAGYKIGDEFVRLKEQYIGPRIPYTIKDLLFETKEIIRQMTAERFYYYRSRLLQNVRTLIGYFQNMYSAFAQQLNTFANSRLVTDRRGAFRLPTSGVQSINTQLVPERTARVIEGYSTQRIEPTRRPRSARARDEYEYRTRDSYGRTPSTYLIRPSYPTRPTYPTQQRYPSRLQAPYKNVPPQPSNYLFNNYPGGYPSGYPRPGGYPGTGYPPSGPPTRPPTTNVPLYNQQRPKIKRSEVKRIQRGREYARRRTATQSTFMNVPISRTMTAYLTGFEVGR